MRFNKIVPALGAAALFSMLGGCSTTARYVTTEHWSASDKFYVGFTEYKETNLIVFRTGDSSAHLILCNASDDNNVQCRPQVEVDRLLNPDKKYADPPPPPPPAAPAAPAESEPEASEGEPNA